MSSPKFPQETRLEIPPGPAGEYRLAQVDDYRTVPRARFPHHPPFDLRLRARVSAPDLPGTWGFGLWNDPFSLSLGFGGGARRFPALPNAAWFFYASPENHLSFRDDLPGHGLLAQTFRSPNLPGWVLAPAALALPLLVWKATARPLRGMASRLIREDAVRLNIDPCAWHTYTLGWQARQVIFTVNGRTVQRTAVSPRGPLGLVIWIDNQYAALPPAGGLKFGTLANPGPAWLEIEML